MGAHQPNMTAADQQVLAVVTKARKLIANTVANYTSRLTSPDTEPKDLLGEMQFSVNLKQDILFRMAERNLEDEEDIALAKRVIAREFKEAYETFEFTWGKKLEYAQFCKDIDGFVKPHIFE